MKVLVETSARHMHVSQEHLEALFGKDHKLTNKKELSQPGQFACEEKVQVVGPKGALTMTILGPTRPATQVEISATDARTIGVPAVVRESGDTANTPVCTLVGPCGLVEISEGVIVAKRHLHTTPEDAQKLGVSDKQIVSLKIGSSNRMTTMHDLVVRVSPSFSTAVHIDTDEANACISNGEGEIVL